MTLGGSSELGDQAAQLDGVFDGSGQPDVASSTVLPESAEPASEADPAAPATFGPGGLVERVAGDDPGGLPGSRPGPGPELGMQGTALLQALAAAAGAGGQSEGRGDAAVSAESSGMKLASRPAPPEPNPMIAQMDSRTLGTEASSYWRNAETGPLEKLSEGDSNNLESVAVCADRLEGQGETSVDRPLDQDLEQVWQRYNNEHGAAEPTDIHQLDARPRTYALTPSQPEDVKEVVPITGLRQGDKRLPGAMRELAYQDPAVTEIQGLRTTHQPALSMAADLFTARTEARLKDGAESEGEPLRIAVLGSGPGYDAAALLDALQARSPEIYDRTEVTVSDKSGPQVEAAKRNPRLLAHMDRAHGGTSRSHHVEFDVLDAEHPGYAEGEVPDMIVVANVLSAFPAKVVAFDDNVYGAEFAVVGVQEKPDIREALWSDAVGGRRPLCTYDPQTGTFELHPPSTIRPSAYLDELRDNEVLSKLMPGLTGRMVSGEDGLVPSELLPQADLISARSLTDWHPEDVSALRQGFVNNESHVVPRRWYNVAPGIQSFIQETVGRAGQRGTMLFVLDDMRKRASGDIRRPIDHNNPQRLPGLSGINSYDGAVMSSTVEAWMMARFANERGAHTRISRGREGDWRAMLIHLDPSSVARGVRMHAAFEQALDGVAVNSEAHIQFREAFYQLMTEAVQQHYTDEVDPETGESSITRFIREGIIRLCEGQANPIIANDHTIFIETSRLYLAQGLADGAAQLATRAVELAGHASVNAYICLAEAQRRLGQPGEAIKTLRSALHVSENSSGVWRLLKDLYKDKEMWAEQADAAGHYFNTAHGLDSRETTTLMLEICTAKENLAIEHRDDVTIAEVLGPQILTASVPIAPGSHRHQTMFGVDTVPIGLPRNAVFARQAHISFRQALTAAQALSNSRDVPRHEPQEAATQEAIRQLHRGVFRTADAAQVNLPPRIDHNRHVLWTPALDRLPALGSDRAEDVRPAPGLYETEIVLDAELVEEDDYAAIEEEHGYLMAARREIGLSEQARTDEISAAVEARWGLAKTTDERLLLAQVFIGRRLTSGHIELINTSLREILVEGGEFADFRREVSALYRMLSGQA